MEEEIAKLEEEASVACKAYDEVVEVRDRLNGEIEQMTSDKKSMMAQIEAEQGDLSGYQRDLAHASEQKSAKEGELATTQKKLSDTQEKKQQMTDTKRKLETDLGSFKKDIEVYKSDKEFCFVNASIFILVCKNSSLPSLIFFLIRCIHFYQFPSTRIWRYRSKRLSRRRQTVITQSET